MNGLPEWNLVQYPRNLSASKKPTMQCSILSVFRVSKVLILTIGVDVICDCGFAVHSSKDCSWMISDHSWTLIYV